MTFKNFSLIRHIKHLKSCYTDNLKLERFYNFLFNYIFLGREAKTTEELIILMCVNKNMDDVLELLVNKYNFQITDKLKEYKKLISNQ